MAYITHEQLADSPGALELAEVATEEHRPPVRAELLSALLRGQDTSAWLPDDVSAAQRAVQRIDATVADACAMIDGYLAKRGYALPLQPVPGLVVGWCRAITRYMLHKDRRTLDDTDRIARGFVDAQRLLTLTAAGKFSLGGQDVAANDQLDARFNSAQRVFSRHQLGAFR